MKISKFAKYGEQYSRLGKNIWKVTRLVELSKGFKVMTVPLDHMNIYNTYEHLSLRQMVSHMKSVQDAELKYPIILDEDGEIMDGRHRIMKALLMGKKTIKAVRFDKNPEACKTED
jgi:hypothetical protein